MTHPLVIVGAGPVGLAAAAQAEARGLSTLVLEVGDSAGAAVLEWGHGENSRTCPQSRTAAPADSPASRTRVLSPRASAWAAAARPTGPAPTMTRGMLMPRLYRSTSMVATIDVHRSRLAA